METRKVDWIQLKFLAGYPFAYYKLLYKPDGTVEYTCDGEDLPFDLPNGHRWTASKRVYQNLAKAILTRPWEQEADPRIEPGMVCDGWTDTLSWSIKGEVEEQSIVIGLGPASLLKIMERIKRLVRDEEKNFSVCHKRTGRIKRQWPDSQVESTLSCLIFHLP